MKKKGFNLRLLIIHCTCLNAVIHGPGVSSLEFLLSYFVIDKYYPSAS